VLDPTLRVSVSGACGQAFFYMVLGLAWAGMHDAARACLERLSSIAAADASCDRALGGWLKLSRAVAAYWFESDLGTGLRLVESGLEDLGEVGDVVGQLNGSAISAYGAALCGAAPRTEQLAARLRELAKRTRLKVFAPFVDFYLFEAKWDASPFDSFRSEIEPYLRTKNAAFYRLYASRLLAACATVDERPKEAQDAIDRLTADDFPGGFEVGHTTSLSAMLALARGDAEEALARADEVRSARRALEPALRVAALLARAEALFALGRADDARAAADEARDFVERVADNLPPELRAAWLARRYCERTLRLSAGG
jgi:tetratricopeptide (TPR) repeat protein